MSNRAKDNNNSRKKENPHMAFFSNSMPGDAGRRQITCFLHCATLVRTCSRRCGRGPTEKGKGL